MKASRTLVALVTLVALAAIAIVPLASAAVSRGEAEAILKAYTTGGRTIVFHASERSNGAPGDILGSHGAIRPLGPWDDRTFCQDDWHAILLTIFDGNELGGPHATAPELKAHLAAVTMSFTLNGQPLGTTRGAVKSFHQAGNFGLEDAFGFQQGTVVKLGPGTYELDVFVVDPIYGDFEEGITFFIDAASCG